jgi:hypothetical protein
MLPSIVYMADGWEPKGYVKTRAEISVQGFGDWKPYTNDLGISSGVYHE